MGCEDMTDFEINANVTALDYGCENWEFNGVEFYHCGIDGSCYFSQPVIDYCNNPSEAWPIIIKNSIVIEPRENKSSLAYLKGDAPCEDKNPLRAAMIVYLMMNETPN